MGERIFTLNDQMDFARFSGDYNPLHIDPVAARRLMFGGPVVHGIHAVLWALDVWLEKHSNPIRLQSIKVLFLKPIMLHESTRFVLTHGPDGNTEITLRHGDSVSTRINLTWTETNGSCSAGLTSQFPFQRSPRILSDADLATGAGILDLCLHTGTAEKLFPYVTRYLSHSQMAVLLHTSRLVGSECPGLHSVYSELALSADDSNGCTGMRYEVSKFDPRFAMVVMKVTAPGLSGSIKAFVRPAPQAQATYSSLKGLVASDEFADQRALVVGGSRGLGEVTAKLLCAGGAQVKITYFRGKEDACRIVDEIVSAGGQADCRLFDVLGLEDDPPGALVDDWSPTHLYYFATPFISSGTKGKFSPELFNKFCGYYVAGLLKTINRIAGSELRNIVYPSTTFVDDVPSDMGEYVAAKMAGEMLCAFLEKTLPKTTIARPRLPRVATDQIGKLMPTNCLDPLPVMLQTLRSVHDRSALTH